MCHEYCPFPMCHEYSSFRCDTLLLHYFVSFRLYFLLANTKDFPRLLTVTSIYSLVVLGVSISQRTSTTCGRRNHGIHF